jgi:hypothetical protein
MTFLFNCGRRPLLKLLAVALVSGGHCLACAATMTPALAAEHPHAAAIERCEEMAVAPSPAPQVSLSQPSPAGAGTCPMGEHYDGLCISDEGAIKPKSLGLGSSCSLAAVPLGQGPLAVSPQTPVHHGHLAPPDRTPTLTGIIVKNE